MRLLFLPLLLIASALPAQQGFAVPDSLDAFIKRALREQRIPGLALAVARNGTVLALRAYGVADRESGSPVTPETRFELGSVSEQFTAAGILLLVDEGKIDLDASVLTYLPDAPEAWSPITVRHLLTHTFGLPPWGKGFGHPATGGRADGHRTDEPGSGPGEH